MNSFDPSNQVENLESKIVVALERISEAFRVLLWEESKKMGISPIQIQILIFILNHKYDLATISYLAQEFNMSKATISDSVRVLEQKKFLEKKNVVGDTRSQSLHLTKEGRRIAQKSSKFATPFEKILTDLSLEKRKSLYSGLLNFIQSFQETNIVSAQRMCFTCKFYQKTNQKHQCKFLKMELQEMDIRMDCNEHIHIQNL